MQNTIFFDPFSSTVTTPKFDGLLLWTMITYDIDSVSDMKYMQLPSDILLFEKVQYGDSKKRLILIPINPKHRSWLLYQILKE